MSKLETTDQGRAPTRPTRGREGVTLVLNVFQRQMGTVLRGDYEGGRARCQAASMRLVRRGLVWNDPQGKPRGSY